MADSQHASGKRRDRRGRQTAASDTQDWEPRRGASRHSLPHRSRQPEIQKSDRKKSKNASRPSRTFEDLADTHSMPGPRLLTRGSASRSRGRQAYDEDDEDDYDDSERERLRGRLRSSSRPAWGGKSAATSRAASRAPSARARPRAKSRPISQGSRSTDSSPAPTPTRSSYAQFRSAPSAPSVGAATDSSTDDSDDSSSGSTQDYHARPRTLKERMNGTPDSEPMPMSANRSRSRHKSHERLPEKLVPEIESPTDDSEDQAVSRPRIIVRKRSVSRPRQAQQSRSRSRPPLSHRRSGRSGRDSGHASVSPKRAPKNYYDSDDSYSREPSYSRSRATSASRMKAATKSVGSSSKQSLGNYFQTSGQPQPQNAVAKLHPCIACGDGMPNKKLAKLKCGHRWCNSCLKRRFKVSIEDPQSMPPRCCTADIIPLKHVNDLFDDNFKKTWNEKFAKYSARDHNYCPKKKCRERIRPADLRHHSDGRTSATCRKCNTEICGLCYKKWHESKHCPTDADTAQFLKAAKDAGWKRCYHCQAMVELKEGCNHMTCRCGAQFCMICGLKWRSCDCPWFSHQLEDEDAMEHMQIPPPMVSRERLGGTDGLPRSLRPDLRPDLAYAQEPRRHRGLRGDDRGRRPPHIHPDLEDEEEDEEDEEDDDYLHHTMSDPMGMGNMAGHYMNDEYQRRPFGVIPPVPVPAAPPATAPAMHERTKSGTNYVSGVNKARGVRASSMERRLADRFSEQRQNFTPPPPRPFGQPVPLTAPPMGMNPPPHQPPMVPSPMTRRHTMDNDLYDAPFDPRYAPQSIPRRPAPPMYMDDLAIHPPMGRRRYRQMEPPRPSELAGLTGPGGGVNRVYEWANHVESHYPDNQTVA